MLRKDLKNKEFNHGQHGQKSEIQIKVRVFRVVSG
jgi:hypothetical protein